MVARMISLAAIATSHLAWSTAHANAKKPQAEAGAEQAKAAAEKAEAGAKQAKAAAKQSEATAEQSDTWLLGEWPKDAPVVSLDLDHAFVEEALEKIAEQTGWRLMIAASEDHLEAEITLKAQGIPVTEVLPVVLETGGLTARLKNNEILVIKPARRSTAHIHTPFARVQVEVDEHGVTKTVTKDEHTTIGGSVVVEKNEVVEGDTVAIGGSVTVKGRVKGEAVAIGGSVILEPGAVVEKNATAIGGEIVVPEGARVEGDRVSIGGPYASLVSWATGIEDHRRGIPGFLLSLLATLVRGIALLILGLLLITFLPDRMTHVREFLEERPGPSVLAGLGLMLGFLPLCILLLVTVVGIPLIPILALILAATLVIGLVSFCSWLGRRVPLFEGRKTPIGALLIGLVIMTLVDLIPVVGSTLIFVVGFVSAGAVLLSRFGKNKPTPTTPPEMVEAL